MSVLILSSNALPLEEEDPMNVEDLKVPQDQDQDQVALAEGAFSVFE